MPMPAYQLMAKIRAEIKRACIFNGLGWQTAARGDFDPQRLSAALANPDSLKNCRSL